MSTKMYLKKRNVKGIIYWSIVESYRENGKVKQKIIKNLGNTEKAISLLEQSTAYNDYLPNVLAVAETTKKLSLNNKPFIVWALFDSGNGSYAKAAEKFDEMEIYSIGLDIKNKNNHFINLNLGDYSYLFGNNHMYEILDKLPKPDLIIASPPCESWSVASAMKGGNACWKKEQVDGLFDPQIPLSRFTIRYFNDYEKTQFKHDKSLIKRVNGELCIFNTIKIIEKYQPSVYIVENPAYGRIWEYIDKVLGYDMPFENLTYYNNYDYKVQKPTKFKSNIELNLKKVRILNEVEFRSGVSRDYNERSNIPGKLVTDIFDQVLIHLKQSC